MDKEKIIKSILKEIEMYGIAGEILSALSAKKNRGSSV